MTTHKMAAAALFAAIISLLAQLSIPLPFSPIPITGSIFGVYLAGALLGRFGATAVLIYILLGAAGLPVFAHARGGLNIILGPTGGYLIGFVLGAYLLGWIIEQKELSWLPLIAGMLICLLSVYLVGTLQLALIAGYTIPQALGIGVLPFIPLDLLKTLLAAIIVNGVYASLSRAGLMEKFRN